MKLYPPPFLPFLKSQPFFYSCEVQHLNMYIWIFLNAKLISLGKSYWGSQGGFIFLIEFFPASSIFTGSAPSLCPFKNYVAF